MRRRFLLEGEGELPVIRATWVEDALLSDLVHWSGRVVDARRRMALVLQRRYGKVPLTQDAVAGEMNLTLVRVKQIERDALRHLGAPLRSRWWFAAISESPELADSPLARAVSRWTRMEP